jgi:serine/threonine protein kinase
MIGKGCSASVFIATLNKPRSKYAYFPPLMAVKSAKISFSASLQKEKEALNSIAGCANVIRCYGDEITKSVDGEMVYNLLLEYASGGTLAALINNFGGKGLPESDVRRYTRSIVTGLNHIHRRGYVHCDLKPENILLVRCTSNKFRAKVGDLGLAKRAKQSKKRKLNPCWKGTPMYTAPEAVFDISQQPPSDIWSLGCIVLEMLTGISPWECKRGVSAKEFLRWISQGYHSPDIPDEISEEGKQFLKACFCRKVAYRFTAEMLLSLPFVKLLVDDDDDGCEIADSREVFDINAVSTVLFSDDDDDWSSDGWSLTSEDESYYESTECEAMENRPFSLQVQERASATSSLIKAV